MSDIEIITDGLQFPEGPVAMPDGSVIVVEIKSGTLTRVAPDGTKTTVAEVGGGPNGLAVGADGALYVCNNGGFVWTEIGDMNLPIGPGGASQPPDYTSGSLQRVDVGTGAVTTLYTECDDNRLNGPNDIVVDKEGGLWFTDLGKTRARDVDRGFIYWAKPDGSEIRQVAAGNHGFNGVGLSPDGSRLYSVETSTARLFAWDVAGPGELAGGNPLTGGGIYLGSGHPNAAFDSLAVEENGNICVATLVHEAGITVFDPGGQIVEQVEFPDPLPTNICFGGDDMRTAWVTLSATGKLAKAPWSRPGLKLNF
ncbi:MAG TPA: SMP-30/gluconolactonase/LRE family protein [Acidimicrobiales bacterium]|nr:SMP-30/gluconolactonase/LRE family protein [Acidimicrobiales bacterium]